MFRIRSRYTGLMALLLVGGCVAPGNARLIDSMSVAPIGPEQAAPLLFQMSGTTMWPAGIVPVCYTSGSDANALTVAQKLLAAQWSTFANVSFTGWGLCGSNPSNSNGEVKIHFVGKDDTNGNGMTSHFGANPGHFTDLYLANNASATQFTYEVLHEFGHALGFAHEQERPDNYNSSGVMIDCTDANGGGKLSGTDDTSYFDFDSIMDYCAGQPQVLSPGDIAGVQSVYGTASWLPRRGTASSNATVARMPNNLDAFFVHPDGSLWTSWWYLGVDTSSGWPTEQLPNAGPGTAPNKAPLAVVSRGNNNIDLFFVANNGSIHTFFWSLDTGVWGDTTVPGTIGLGVPGSQVAAVAPSPGAIDVLFTGTDHNLYASHFSASCGDDGTHGKTLCNWSSSPVKVVSDGSLPAGAAVTAVARTADRLDAFYIASDSTPHQVSCVGFHTGTSADCTNSNWSGLAMATISSCNGTPGEPIAAAARNTGNLDVFYSTKNHAFCNSFWSQSSNQWGSLVIGSSSGIAIGSSLAAQTRGPSELEISFIEQSGSSALLHLFVWSSNTWGDTQLPSNYIGTPTVGGQVGMAARSNNNIDIFALDYTGANVSSLMTAFWYGGATSWTVEAADNY